MNPAEIVYPVFKIASKSPTTIDNSIVVLSNMRDTDGTEIEKVQYIDDKNIPGNTLGMRRLQLKYLGTPLYKLKYAIYFFGDLIKLSDGNTWFIDNSGKLFKYKKTKIARLSYYKINNVLRIPSGGAIVEVKGISNRFKVLFAPDIDKQYAGILSIGMEYIFYGFYDKAYKESWRKV